jgi:hypothetical protein
MRVAARRVMAVPYLACMALVASLYHLPPRVLPSIHAVEGGGPGTVHRNRDGSEDLGVMQVNTIWIKPLAAYTHLDETTLRTRLVWQPCFNIAAAGAILRNYIDEAHGDLMLAIGDYHSHTPALGAQYRARVMQAAAELFGRARAMPGG